MRLHHEGFVAAIAAVSIGASAPDRAAAPTISFDIPQQPLDRALQVWANQADMQVLIGRPGPEAIQRSLKGDFSKEEGLTRLLEGTDYTFCFTEHNAAMIIQKLAGSPLTPGACQDQRPLVRESTEKERYAYPAVGTPSYGLSEVLVRGSRSTNADIQRTENDTQPHVVLDQKVISQSGRGNATATINSLLTMTGGAGNTAEELGYRSNLGNINLRGLGTNQTLILVDGRRYGRGQISGRPQQPSINGIPLSAIERIDVLPATSSGIYGGSATGGVVNVILKDDYSGVETALTYGNALRGGARSRQVDIGAGFSFGQTSVQFFGNYTDSDALEVRERRPLAENAREQMSKSGIPPLLSKTTNIRSESNEELVFKTGEKLRSSITFVPEGYAGISTDDGAALIANAGRFNLDLAPTAQPAGGEDSAVVPKITTAFSRLKVLHQLTNSVAVFVEGDYQLNQSRLATNLVSPTFTLAADSPNNPFNQTVVVSVPGLGANGFTNVKLSSLRYIGGGKFSLGENWNIVAEYTYHTVDYSASAPPDISVAGRTAVERGGLDVMRDVNISGFSLAGYLNPPSRYPETSSTLETATVRIGGSVWELDGGPLRVSISGEKRWEHFDSQPFDSAGVTLITPKRGQSVRSIYAEGSIPFFSEQNRLPGIHSLSALMAFRYDRYETRAAEQTLEGVKHGFNELSSFDPTLGLRWEPYQWMLLRASWSTGFTPPDVDQIVSIGTFTAPGAVLKLTDPRRDGEAIGDLQVTGGGNPNLKPEESKSWSAGVVFSPKSFPLLRASLDWVRTDKADEISNIALVQTSINDELLLPEGVITRRPFRAGESGSVGPIVAFDASQRNIRRRQSDALDLAIDAGSFSVAGGRLDVTGRATRLLHSRVQPTPAHEPLDDLGLIQALPWKAVGEARWKWRTFGAVWTTRYLSGYWLDRDHEALPGQGARVGGQLYHDVHLQLSSASGKTGIELGLINVLDKRAPLDLSGTTTSPLYVSPLSDVFGRSLFVTVRTKF